MKFPAYSLIAAAFAISPAVASIDDSVSLLITGSSGAVVTVEGMTQRECDAAASLLNTRKGPTGSGIAMWSGSTIMPTLTVGDPPLKKDPSIATVKCMRPTDSK